MPLISADAIYSPQGWVRDQALWVDDTGRILGWRPLPGLDRAALRHLDGLLVPGWVNAHCHLELSALRGHIDEATGMAGFIGQLFRARAGLSPAALTEACAEALRSLAQTGTAAVGDISNLPLSAAPKAAQDDVYVHTFIELLGLDPAEAEARLAGGQAQAQAFADLPHSLTPHAPYSTSEALLRLIYQQQEPRYSLHLLESQEEVELFAFGGGPLAHFYREIGLPFQPFTQTDPLRHALRDLPPQHPTLLVHNVELPPARLAHLAAQRPQTWFCLCPRTNWYIHRRQPTVAAFAQLTDRICLGTDSLASNHDLDLFGEVQALQRAFPSLPLHRLLRWATTCGAEALGIAKKFGTFVPYSQPGVLWLKGVETQQDDFRLTVRSQVEVLYRGAGWQAKG